MQSLQFQIQTWHNLCVNDYCFCSYSISKVLFLTVILMQRRRPPRPAEARAAAGQWQGGQLPAAGDSAVRCREGAGSYTATLLHSLHCYTALHTRYTPHYTHSDQWLATVGFITSPLVLTISRSLLKKGWALRSKIIKQWALGME